MANKDRFDRQGRPIQKAIPEWIYGEPTLFSQGNGSAEWARAARTSVLPTDQKSTTGWLARLNGGVQTGWDDAAALYIPVNEMPLTSLKASGGGTQWTYWMAGSQTFGCQISIWVHDPEDNSKRVDIIQLGNVAGLEKASGWNKHILNKATASQFFWIGENAGSPGLITGSGNLYSLEEFQADTVFKDWTIYRISLNNGFENSGTFGDMYVADVKLNGTVIPLKPEWEWRGMNSVRSSGIKTADVLLKATPGKVYWMSMSDTAAGVAQLADSADGNSNDLYQMTIPADGYGHIIFDPALEFKTAIYLDVPTGTPDIIVGYV